MSEQCRVKLTAGRVKSQGGVNGIKDVMLVPISLFGYLPGFSYCEMANGRTCLLPLDLLWTFLIS